MNGSEAGSNGQAAETLSAEDELDLLVAAVLADERLEEDSAAAFIERATAFLKRRRDAAALLERLRAAVLTAPLTPDSTEG
jgi:hypothetical protein